MAVSIRGDTMTELTGQAAGKAICEALGLDPSKVKAIALNFEVGDVATADVVMYVENSDIGRIVTVVKEYTLEEKKLR